MKSPELGFEPRRGGYAPVDLESTAISQALPLRLYNLEFARNLLSCESVGLAVVFFQIFYYIVGGGDAEVVLLCFF